MEINYNISWFNKKKEKALICWEILFYELFWYISTTFKIWITKKITFQRPNQRVSISRHYLTPLSVILVPSSAWSTWYLSENNLLWRWFSNMKKVGWDYNNSWRSMVKQSNFVLNLATFCKSSSPIQNLLSLLYCFINSSKQSTNTNIPDTIPRIFFAVGQFTSLMSGSHNKNNFMS